MDETPIKMPTMMTIADDHRDNHDISMSTSSSPVNKSPPPSSNKSSPITKHSYLIKIEFKTNSQAFPAPEIHQKIILEIESFFPSTTINTNTNPSTAINASKHTNEFFLRNFNYPSFSRSKFSLVCVGHNITTEASFAEITEATKKTLSQNKALGNFFSRTKRGNKKLIFRCTEGTMRNAPKKNGR